jgi:hypothetical protein
MPRRLGGAEIAAIAIIVVSFGIGGVTSVTEVTPYLHDHFHLFSNVTDADLEALGWAGEHLPNCSRVMAAPGSAALFLPLYASVAIDFPMEPLPLNLSYNIAVANLTSGVFSSATNSALLELGITVVFVTQQNSVSYLAFQPAALLGSHEFARLYVNGDAQIFAFEPGEALTGCTA